MSTERALPDQRARREALDVSRSFIVQAPAGSGKTELLTLRFLCLLACSAQPEEILAITFTRKAASEMRDRIIGTLRWARQAIETGCQPEKSFERERLAIAKRVLERDQTLSWRLEQSPSRLRIQTIDSFCAYLARQLPVLSRLGGRIPQVEDADPCYQEAIANTLEQLNGEAPVAEALSHLLQHLDNDFAQVRKLLTELLGKRDQWLPHILSLGQESHAFKESIRRWLAEFVGELLSEARAALLPCEAELVELVNFSLRNRAPDEVIDGAAGLELDRLPAAEIMSLPLWREIAELLTAKSTGDWRRQVNKRSGFPANDNKRPQNKLMKERFIALIESLEKDESTLPRIVQILQLPDNDLNHREWDFLVSLQTVLLHLCSELLLSFARHQQVDFIQTSLAALTALGDEDNPTDLALALDHRIQHILVDEFQDTNNTQMQLLERLTRGWQWGDGHSLFLVGDPMQSIYGFRNANVGLFLAVQETGIGQIRPETLVLQANFRSQAQIVDWVNQHFAAAFPSAADPSRGAVPYAHSVAVHDADPDASVTVELIAYDPEQRDLAREQEAQRIVQAVNAWRDSNPDDSIAILARSRSHFAPIVAALRTAQIPWQAADVDRLSSVMAVEDLLSLTRALLNPADRLAWFAILRAPWCGLSGPDLLVIADHAPLLSVWSTLQDPDLLNKLSEASRSRLAEVIQVLDFALRLRFRRPLRQLVEATWTLLRGAATCESRSDLDSVAQFFVLLETHERGGGLADVARFEAQVAAAFLPSPQSAATGGTIRLLTMHKAKGLEFDHVILPGLAWHTGQDRRPLLIWHERLNRAGVARLFLAGRAAAGAEDSKLYRLLRGEQQLKRDLETTRLLYIAVTRARRSALLIGSVSTDEAHQLLPPDERSLLSKLWPYLEHGASPALTVNTANAFGEESPAASDGIPIRRLREGLRLTEPEKQALSQQLIDPTEDCSQEDHLIEEDPVAACAGTLIHRALEWAVRDPQRLRRQRTALPTYWRRELARVTQSAAELEQSITFIERALSNCLDNPDFDWIFSPWQQDSACELPLTRQVGSGLRQVIIDRTFVDADNCRWIIDYKTAAPGENQTTEAFIDAQKQRYSRQLETYRQCFATLEARPRTRLALLLTALPTLVEID